MSSVSVKYNFKDRVNKKSDLVLKFDSMNFQFKNFDRRVLYKKDIVSIKFIIEAVVF